MSHDVLKQISPIMASAETVEQFSAKNRKNNQSIIDSYRKNRKLLIEEANELGLRTKPLSSDFAINDLFEIDDGGKLLETFFKVVISSIDEAKKVVTFAKEKNLGIITIGSRTSAIGLFECHTQALRVGLEGIIGVYIQRGELDLSNSNFSGKEIVVNSDKTIASIGYDTDAFSVVAHASTTVTEINDFLNSQHANEKFYFRVMPDPTSMYDAKLGGIIATGAQGGNRTNAAHDLTSIWIVSADAELKNLEGSDAKNCVGLNGTAGIIIQAEFQVTKLPKHEHGIYIPVGNSDQSQQEIWQSLLLVQDLLKEYCDFNQLNQVVTSIEVMSAKGLILAQDRHPSPFLSKILTLHENTNYGLFITFQDSIEVGSEEIFLSKIFQILIGNISSNNEIDINFDSNDCIVVDSKYNLPFEKFLYLSKDELIALDQIRHAVPNCSRELARRLGGITESSDVNIRVKSNNKSERLEAYKSLSTIYSDYINSFSSLDGFDLVVYGHLHPGYGVGGGINPHVRIIFELSNPGSRYNAPEQVSALKKRKSEFEKRLIALDGKNSIEICVPEKSCFGSAEYWNWLSLNYPLKATERLQIANKLGTTKDGLELFTFRIPRKLPKFIHLPAKYAYELSKKDSITISQLPAKSASIQKLALTVNCLLRKYFNLPEFYYSFVVDSDIDVSELLNKNTLEVEFKEYLSKQTNEISTNVSKENICLISFADALPNLNIKILLIPLVKIALSKANTNFNSIKNWWSLWPYSAGSSACSISLVDIAKYLISTLKIESSNIANQLSQKNIPIYAGVSPAKFIDNLSESFYSQAPIENVDFVSNKLKDLVGIPDNYKLYYASSVQKILVELAKNCKKNNLKVIVINGDPFSNTALSIFKSLDLETISIRVPWTTAENSQLQFVVSKIQDIFTADYTNNTKQQYLIFLVPHKTSTTADVHPDHLINELASKNLLVGNDYHLFCDVSSAVGARHYATLLSPDTGKWRVSFNGVIGSFQGAFGLPAGCCFFTLPPSLSNIFEIDQSNIDIFGRWFNAFLSNNYESTIFRQQNCYRKFRLVLGWLERHPDLICLVPNSVDQSPALLGIFSQAKNLPVARRLLRDIFGYIVDPGYGAFEKESIRLYLANISEEELLKLLSALDLVLELPDVVLTRGENVPNIALREPHDPLSVIERLSKNLTVDDLIRNQLALAWLSRLIRTFNSNVDQLRQVPIDGEPSSGEYKMKARIYAAGLNLREMQKILSLKDEETRLDIIFHYELFRDVERHIRRRLHVEPSAQWSEDSNSAAISLLLKTAKEQLVQLCHLLNKYVRGDDVNCRATFDKEGRVSWPIVA
jgi:hypothetical protein